MKENYGMEMVGVRLVREAVLEPEKYIANVDDAVETVKKFISSFDREVTAVINLNAKGRILNMQLVSMGSLMQSTVDPGSVYKAALLSNAASIILFHNHPSGDPTPSEEDTNVTKRLEEAGRILGVELLDHIIAGRDEYYSFSVENEL